MDVEYNNDGIFDADIEGILDAEDILDPENIGGDNTVVVENEHDFLDRRETNMTIGTNGLMIESADSHVYFVYTPGKRILEVKSAKNSPNVSLKVEGDVYASGENIDMMTKIKLLEEKCSHLDLENARLSNMITEIYYAPGMPGYIQAETEFSNKMCQGVEEK